MGLEGVEKGVGGSHRTRTGHQGGLEGSLELPILHGGPKFYVTIGVIKPLKPSQTTFMCVRSRASGGLPQVWRVACIAIEIGFRCF